MKKVLKIVALLITLPIIIISISTTPSSAVIIGEDDRINEAGNCSKAPYKGICFIESKMPNGKYLYGTAWLYEDNGTLGAVTAAHCVYNEEMGGMAKYVKVQAGRSGQLFIKSQKSSDIAISPQYEKGYPEHDMAVIKLSNSTFKKCFKFFQSDDEDYLDRKVRLCGYPAETKEEQENLAVYKSIGFIDDYDDDLLYYELDTESGESGAPIYVLDDGDYYVIGMNVAHDEDETQNIGIRLQGEKMDELSDLFYELS